MFQSQISAASWPIPGDVPDLKLIITEQADTVAAQAALIDGYQADLNAVQNPPPGPAATGTGTATGTSLAVTVLTGTIVNGATITDGALVPANTTVLGQISGTVGGSGTYLTSNPTTASNTALTFTPPPVPGVWPIPTDAPTLTLIQQQQSGVLRLQTALIQAYQDLLNTSQTPAPPTGP